MKYIQYGGFASQLVEKLADVDTDLPIHPQHIVQLLGRVKNGMYTILKIYDGTNTEYVRVVNRNDALSIERGLELTNPTTFPVGACITWELTPTAVRDIVCQMPCCPD